MPMGTKFIRSGLEVLVVGPWDFEKKKEIENKKYYQRNGKRWVGRVLEKVTKSIGRKYRPTDQLADHETIPKSKPTNRPTDQPTNRPTDRPTDRPTHPKTDQPTNPP